MEEIAAKTLAATAAVVHITDSIFGLILLALLLPPIRLLLFSITATLREMCVSMSVCISMSMPYRCAAWHKNG